MTCFIVMHNGNQHEIKETYETVVENLSSALQAGYGGPIFMEMTNFITDKKITLNLASIDEIREGDN